MNVESNCVTSGDPWPWGYQPYQPYYPIMPVGGWYKCTQPISPDEMESLKREVEFLRKEVERLRGQNSTGIGNADWTIRPDSITYNSNQINDPTPENP